jgi:hypothetical protein
MSNVSKTITIADFNIDAEFLQEYIHDENVDVQEFNDFVDEFKTDIITEAQDFIDDEDTDEIPHMVVDMWYSR